MNHEAGIDDRSVRRLLAQEPLVYAVIRAWEFYDRDNSLEENHYQMVKERLAAVMSAIRELAELGSAESIDIRFKHRELLVQDVIAATRALISCENDHCSRAEVRTRVLNAARKLEEWKP